MSYDLPKGRYPYPLNYLASDGGKVTTDFVQGDPTVQAGSTNWYVLCLTPEQLLDVMSLVEVGAPIAFPETYNEISTIFWQMREFPNQFPEGSCVDICDLVLNCIETNGDIQNAIAQLSLGSGIDGDTPEDSETLATDMFGGQSSGCNNDNIFGATTQLVDFLNQVSSDVLELFETAFATPSRFGDAIEAIPGIGELPFDDALQFLEKLAQQVKSAYDAAYDTQIRDDFRCDLFCMAQSDCELTFEEARDYFQSKITVTVANTDFNTMVGDIIQNNWLGEQSIYMMHWFILDAIIFGTEVLGVNTDRLVTQVATFFNDPDADWNVICDPCTQFWSYNSDFAVSPNGWTPTVLNGFDLAFYDVGVNWVQVDVNYDTNQYGRFLIMDVSFADPVIVNTFNINYDFTPSSYPFPNQILRAYYQGNVVALDRDDNASGSGLSLTITPNQLVDRVQVNFRMSVGNNPTSGYQGDVSINFINGAGQGAKPPELS